MPMKKSEMSFEREEYDTLAKNAGLERKNGRYWEALLLADASKAFVHGKIQFERHLQGRNQVTLEGQDIVLDLAPLFFCSEMLDSVAVLFADNRRIGKFLSETVAQKMAASYEFLQVTYDLWDLMESHDSLSDRDPAVQTTKAQFALRFWWEAGYVRQFSTEQGISWRLDTRLTDIHSAICPSCGFVLGKAKSELLGVLSCPECAMDSEFTFLVAETAEGRGRR